MIGNHALFNTRVLMTEKTCMCSFADILALFLNNSLFDEILSHVDEQEFKSDVATEEVISWKCQLSIACSNHD